MNPAVFLDRDNTLIVNDGDLGDPEQVRLVQGAASAIASLCGLGYRVVVVTNQGGVARGKYTENDVRAVHERIRERVIQGSNGARIDDFYFCPYHPEAKVSRYRDENHEDRKPNPGMLVRAAADHKLDLSQSWMVGDQERDIEAGRRAGTRTVLLRPEGQGGNDASAGKAAKAKDASKGGGETSKSAEETSGGDADFCAKNLVEAVRLIAQSRKPEAGEVLSREQASGKRWDTAAVARLQQTKPAAPPPPEASSEAPHSKKSDPSPDSAKPEDTSAKPAKGERSAPRPFRPWGAPPPPEETDPPRPHPRKPTPRNPASRKPADTKSSAGKPTSPTASTHEEDASPEPTPGPKPEPRATPAPEPEPSRESEPTPDASARLLRQILQELRAQRGGDDFAMLKIVAMVLQTIAGICLLGALWMGGADLAAYLQWIGAGLMFQMATVAVLLFSRQA